MACEPALVLTVDTMIDDWSAVAAGPTAAQLCVEHFEHLGGDLAERHVPERGLDVSPRVALVAAQRVVPDLVDPVFRPESTQSGSRLPVTGSTPKKTST
jgi:hypothetical protein